MGWNSGVQLAQNIWSEIEIILPGNIRKKVAKILYDYFTSHDADDFDNSEGSLYATAYPNECEIFEESLIRPEIVVGSLIEDCSLMPAIVIDRIGNDVRVRRLDFDRFKNAFDKYEEPFGSCGVGSCGVRMLTAHEVKMRITLGKDKLVEIWGNSNVNPNEKDGYALYDSNIELEYKIHLDLDFT